MGDVLPVVVWPSDVDAYKRKLNPDFVATNAAVAACVRDLFPRAAFPVQQAAAWSDFYTAWGAFYQQSTPLFGTANQYDEAKAYEARLSQWQAQLSATCPLFAPVVVPPPGADLSWLPWAAAAVITVGAVYLFGPAIRAVLPRRS